MYDKAKQERELGSLAGLVLLACNRLTTDCVKLLELSLYAEMSRITSSYDVTPGATCSIS